VKEVCAALDELRVQPFNVLDVEVHVEHVGRNALAVRYWRDSFEAGEVHMASVARGVPVVVRDPVVRLDREAECVAVVLERPPDIVDEQDCRVACQQPFETKPSSLARPAANAPTLTR
jgi:hypothetical protein